jgi:hypothetical protein
LVADDGAAETKLGRRAARRFRHRPLCHERPVGHPDRWNAEPGSEMEGEAASARVVASGGIHQEDVGR